MNTFESTSPPALRLDVRTLAHAGGTQSGNDPLLHYQRLASDLHGGVAQPVLGEDALVVQWTVRGELAELSGAADGKPQPWMHLHLEAQLPMTCQRCLGRVLMPVTLDNKYRFVPDEATAEAQDEACDEDLLVLSKQFDLRELLEDELLLELPLMPKHEVCPTPVKLASTDEDFKAALTQKPNAFAVLGSLKKAP
jgi:uncharacterized protein